MYIIIIPRLLVEKSKTSSLDAYLDKVCQLCKYFQVSNVQYLVCFWRRGMTEAGLLFIHVEPLIFVTTQCSWNWQSRKYFMHIFICNNLIVP